MSFRLFKRFGVAALLGAFLTMGPQNASRAQFIVAQGWDLFGTVSGPTTFKGFQFNGVPLGNFDFTKGTYGDFGRHIGIKNVGGTDTIVKRLDIANIPGPGTATIRLEMVGLLLKSASQINYNNNGLAFYYVTLQSDRHSGEPPPVTSSGNMSITFTSPNGGTFSSTINVAYDIRKGSSTGTIVDSGVVPMNSTNVPWGRLPAAGQVVIYLVNQYLKAPGDPSWDFFPTGFQETHSFTVHQIQPPPPCCGASPSANVAGGAAPVPCIICSGQ